jgi:hypothetical protein
MYVYLYVYTFRKNVKYLAQKQKDFNLLTVVAWISSIAI